MSDEYRYYPCMKGSRRLDGLELGLSPGQSVSLQPGFFQDSSFCFWEQMTCSCFVEEMVVETITGRHKRKHVNHTILT